MHAEIFLAQVFSRFLSSSLRPIASFMAMPSPSLCLSLTSWGSRWHHLHLLSAVQRLEDAFRAAHQILGSSFAPPHLSLPLNVVRARVSIHISGACALVFLVCLRVRLEEPRRPPTNTEATRSKVALRTPTVNCLGENHFINLDHKIGALKDQKIHQMFITVFG